MEEEEAGSSFCASMGLMCWFASMLIRSLADKQLLIGLQGNKMVQYCRGGLARAGKGKADQKMALEMQKQKNAKNPVPIPQKKEKTGRAKMRQQFNRYNNNPKPEHLNRNKQEAAQKDSTTIFSNKKWAKGPTFGVSPLSIHF